MEQVDSMPQYLDVRQPQLFQAGNIRAIVDPRRLEYGVPIRSDLLVLQMLKDNLGNRPLYIAHTSGGYIGALGLEPYALAQGMASKIMDAPLVATADTVRVEGVGHLDVPRSRALWRQFGAPRAIIARGDWVDRPSVSIPLTYLSTALLLGDVLERGGRDAESDSVRRTAVDLAQATRTLDLIVNSAAPPPPAAVRGDAPRGTAVPVGRP
jgi:hypothetical protein